LQQGEEVLHLPVIVESAESSPQAATVAAKTIRKFLSKENYGRPHVQYNAVMLIRILSDNPGASFTRNLDAKFTATVKELLRTGKDPSVQQILRETLAALYVDKAYDTNLNTLFHMWSKESGGAVPPPNARSGINAPMISPPPMGYQQQQPRESYQRRRREAGLPPPGELAQRIEEAKTSAKLLQQLVQSTPPAELQGNDLVKEFAERCQTAQRSVQGYINCDNPPPDDETMQTLIETSEQLSLAASKHQRAILQARRSVANSSPLSNVSAPPGPPPQTMSASGMGNTGYSSPTAAPSSTFIPSESQPFTAYSPPPVPPPSMRANLERRITDPSPPPAPLTAHPPSTQAPQIPAPPAQAALSDNPFSDDHGHTEEDDEDDPYYHPKPTNPATTSTLATVGTRPAPRDQDSWRDPIPEEDSHSETSHPTFTSTPSYVQRQESATHNLTMRGAVSPREAMSPREAVSPVYEPNSGEVSPVEQHRASAGKGGSAAPGYRY
jgi:hypothetical protein